VGEFGFASELKVRFAETDAQGVAHHASYFVWLEIARVEYLDRFDGGYPGLRAEGIEALPGAGPLRRPPARLDALRRPAGSALPLRVRDRAGLPPAGRGLDDARLRRRAHAAADAGARLVEAGDR
jgi:hypothetical protein